MSDTTRTDGASREASGSVAASSPTVNPVRPVSHASASVPFHAPARPLADGLVVDAPEPDDLAAVPIVLSPDELDPEMRGTLEDEERGTLDDGRPEEAKDGDRPKPKPSPLLRHLRRRYMVPVLLLLAVVVPIAVAQQLITYEYMGIRDQSSSSSSGMTVRQLDKTTLPNVSVDREGLSELLPLAEDGGRVVSGDSLDPSWFSSYEITQVAEITHCQDVSYANGYLFAPSTGIQNDGRISIFDVEDGFRHVYDMIVPPTPSGTRPHCNSMEFGPPIQGEEYPLLYCHTGGGNGVVYRIRQSGETWTATYVCRQTADVGSLIGIDKAEATYCAFDRGGKMCTYELHTAASDHSYGASDLIQEARTVGMPIMTQGAFCSGGALWIAHGLHEHTPFVGVYDMETGEVLHRIDMTPYDTAEAEGLEFWDGNLYYISIMGRVWQIHPTGGGNASTSVSSGIRSGGY